MTGVSGKKLVLTLFFGEKSIVDVKVEVMTVP